MLIFGFMIELETGISSNFNRTVPADESTPRNLKDFDFALLRSVYRMGSRAMIQSVNIRRSKLV